MQALSYDVYHKEHSVDGHYDMVNTNVIPVILDSLKANTTYDVYAQAVRNQDYSEPSKVAHFTTDPSGLPPGKPGKPEFSNIDNESFTAEWTKPTEGSHPVESTFKLTPPLYPGVPSRISH